MNDEIRIVIADDHHVSRIGLREVIGEEIGMRIIAEAENGRQALEMIRSLLPDIAILDIEMPEMSGFDVLQAAGELPVAVIFLTMHKDEKFLNAALDHRAKGYVLKDSAVNEIVDAVKAVIDGGYFVSPALSTILVNQRHRAQALREKNPGIDDLTPSEYRVLRMIAANKTSKEIADELCVAESTVNKHRENICRKLDLHGSHALLNFALEHKSELH